MSCDRFTAELSELVDGTLDLAMRARVEAHVEACDDCRALLADLRAIKERARGAERLAPPESLWPRIAARLRDQGAAPANSTRIGRASTWQWMAIAAVLVLGVGLALFVTWSRRPATTPATTTANQQPQPAPPAGSTTPGNAAAPQSVEGIEAELTAAEQHYDRAIKGLEQIAATGQGSLDPQVAATLKKNLQVIDGAIADSRSALKAQPQNQVARETLFEALRRKVVLLQDTIALMNEMRKGNQAGAAQLVEGLNKS
jgi:hypothetical protein